MTITNFDSKVLVAHQVAVSPPGFAATSATSLAIGTGSKPFVTQPNLAYRPGSRVRLISAADPTNYMEGNVTSYSASAMTVNVTRVGPTSSGTHADWSIVSAGDPGSGDLLSTLNLSDLTNKPAALINLGVPPLIRTRLTAPLAFYVNAATGNNSNDGLSPGTAFLTMQAASDYIQQRLDLNGFPVSVYCAEGVGPYAPLRVKRPYVGDTGGLVTFWGSLNRTIIGATNATPIVIMTDAPHNFTNGMHVVQHGIVGNNAANGAFVVGSVTATTFALKKEIDGSNVAGNGAYVSGGNVSSPRNCVISGGSSPAIQGEKSASFSIGGFSVTSLAQGIVSMRDADIDNVGPMDLGQCGSDQLYATRGGYLEMAYNFSISGGSSGGGWAQGSHRGEVRKACTGYFAANVDYAVGGAFAFVDYGEIIDTTIGAFVVPILSATNATPIVITTNGNHGFSNGDVVPVELCTGNTAANGAWRATSVAPTTIALVNDATGANSVGNGAYTGGGLVVGAGFTWNKQGFTVQTSGSINQYSQTQNGNIQAIGNNPPLQNYYPGNVFGVVPQGNSTSVSGTWLSIIGDSFNVIGGNTSGFLVWNPQHSAISFQVEAGGNAEFFGTLGVGTNSTSTAYLTLHASTAAMASLSFGGGVAPTSPLDGQLWFDGTGLKFRLGGVTRTITMT